MENNHLEKTRKREKTIIKTSIIGIIANAMLSVTKAIIGLLTNSIAIVLDAVNNLSDAASSLITIVGTKIARKRADKKHPFGHGRLEYFSATLISMLVLYAGITSLISSIKKIITPEVPDYTTISMIIVALAIVVKIVLGLFVSKIGKKVNSDSLANSGKDAILDSIISASTLVAALIFILFNISLEAYLGGIISLVIIKSGVQMLIETVSRLLGERTDVKLVQDIKNTVKGFKDVNGAYDLILNDYGPNSMQGSIHIDVPDTYTADQLDVLSRNIAIEVYKKHNVKLTAVGIYSINTHDERINAVRDDVVKIALSHEFVKQVHGFYLDDERKLMRFDVVISFNAKDREEVCDIVVKDVQSHYKGYELTVTLDGDFSEL